MHYAMLMRKLDRGCDGFDNSHRFAHGERAASQSRLQICPVDEIHRDEIAAARESPQPFNLNDVRMAQAGQNLGLLNEPRHRSIITLPRLVKGLDRDLLSRPLITSSKYLAHAAGAK